VPFDRAHTISYSSYIATISCTINKILSLISQNLKKSRDSEHISFETNISCVRLYSCVNQYTKFEVPGFTNYKDMIGGKIKKNGSRHSVHAHLRGDLSQYARI